MATSTTSSRAAVRMALGALLAIGAINAFGGGAYGLAGARGVPTGWLAGSPFHSYFVPSLILVIVVGGALATAAVAVLVRARFARRAARVAAVILLGWITVQVTIIGFVSWLQPVVALGALAVLALAYELPDADADAA